MAPSQSSVLESVKVTVYALRYCTPFGATLLTDYPLWGADHPSDICQESGWIMDSSLCFLSHVNHVISSSFYQLINVKNCKGDSHSSKTANIILPGLMIKQR